MKNSNKRDLFLPLMKPSSFKFFSEKVEDMFEIKKSDKLTLFYESRRLENKFRTGRESLTSSTRLVAFYLTFYN